MRNGKHMVLETQSLSAGYTAGKLKRIVLENVTLKALSGELICLLGPNGSGKSTLLRTITGIQPPLDGEIQVTGRKLESYPPPELARKLSVVLTDRVDVANLSVYSLISLGRYPYTDWLGNLTARDREAIDYAIRVTGLSSYENRSINELSDGERQKVMIARALAQETPVMVLDEPTAFLDLPNKLEVMHILKKLSHEEGKTILLSTHDLEIALEVADKIWLISNGLETGIPEDLVLNGSFEKAFSRNHVSFNRDTGRFRFRHDYHSEIALAGDSTMVFWTGKALERMGYRVSDTAAVSVYCNSLPATWDLIAAGKSQSFSTLEDLLNHLAS